MKIGDTEIEDTFAEAFGMKYVRLIVTAEDEYWLDAGLKELTGYSSSVIACDAETGIEQYLPPEQTPDGRIGAAVLIFGFSTDGLQKAVPNRVGQCVMTCPSTAVFDGLPDGDKQVALGKQIRFFGDGFQKAKILGDDRHWRIPVMDGEFLCEEFAYKSKAIGGGNFLILGNDIDNVLKATEAAVKEMNKLKNIILPFPGGVVRSGSKVGSKYKSLIASTNSEYCPAIKGIIKSKLNNRVNCVLEVVIDGLQFDDILNAMKIGIRTIITGKYPGIIEISAGNYGGKLGPHLFHLKEILK